MLSEECELVTMVNVYKGRLEVTTTHVYYFDCSSNKEEGIFHINSFNAYYFVLKFYFNFEFVTQGFFCNHIICLFVTASVAGLTKPGEVGNFFILVSMKSPYSHQKAKLSVFFHQ